MSTIKVIAPDGNTTSYEGTYDKETRTITMMWGKKIHVAATDRVEESACFVATSVYGSSYASQVDVLRSFRDRVILPSWPGGVNLVCLYYRIGPHAARFLDKHPVLKLPIRKVLNLIVLLIQRRTVHAVALNSNRKPNQSSYRVHKKPKTARR